MMSEAGRARSFWLVSEAGRSRGAGTSRKLKGQSEPVGRQQGRPWLDVSWPVIESRKPFFSLRDYIHETNYRCTR